MVFDAPDYKKRVLSQYTRGKLGVLQAALRELDGNPALTLPTALDLAEFYDMAPGLTDAEVAAQIGAVGDTLSKALSNPAYSGAGKNLLGLHERLVSRNPGLRTAAFWAGLIEAGSQRARQGLDDFGANAAAELSALGVVTSSRLRELAKASGVDGGVSDADLAAAVAKTGSVTVVPELVVTPAAPQLLKEVIDGLKKTTKRSILSVIFLKDGEPASFGILDGFRSNPAGAALTVQALHAAHDYSEKLPDTDENAALGKILATIKTAVKSDSELSELAIAYFVEVGRQVTKELPLQSMALKVFVERTGLERVEAARVLLHVGGSSTPERGWPEVQALVSAGVLKEARRLYETKFAELAGSTSSEQQKALLALEGAERLVAELTATARTAVESGDLESARKALDKALTLCTDDPSLVETARALPPAAPLKLSASVREGRRVRLSWEPGFGSTDDVRYQVIRKAGSAPVNNQDGVVLGSARTETSFDDDTAPVATELFYGVAATRGGGFSPVAVATIMVLPPVADVKVASDLTSVSLGWTSPVDSRSVEVVQSSPDGSMLPLPVSTQSGARAQGLATGATYTFLLTAIYTGAAGQTLRSESVRVTAVPRGEPKAVASFTITQRTGGSDQGMIDASWSSVPGYPVEVWHFAQNPGWAFRSRLPMSEIRAQGSQLSGQETSTSAQRSGVRGPTAVGLRYYAAITRDNDIGIVGQVQAFGTCPPVNNTKAERFGDEVVLAWDWPGAEFGVLVRWKGPSGTGERLVSLSDYKRDGGCRIALGSAGGVFTLLTVAGDSDDQWVSTESSISVSGAATSASYDVEFQRRLFGGATAATITFSSASSEPIDVVVVCFFGKVMPFDATQGRQLTRTSVRPGEPIELALPSGKGPLWVRAFSDNAGVRLVDPPISRMKVD